MQRSFAKLESRLNFAFIIVAHLTFYTAVARADDAGDGTIAAETEAIDAREIKEAKELFSIIRVDSELLNGREIFWQCEYPVGWSQDIIPKYIARDEFDFKIHGDLVGSDHGTELKELLGQKETDASAFCTLGEASKLDAERRKELESHNEKRIMIDHSTFAFPVFDAVYHKAIVVIRHSSTLLLRVSSGVKSLPEQAVIFAAVFEKLDGHWRKTKTIPISVS